MQCSMGVDGNAILRDASRKALHCECSDTKSMVADTMGTVAMDGGVAIIAREASEGASQVGMACCRSVPW